MSHEEYLLQTCGNIHVSWLSAFTPRAIRFSTNDCVTKTEEFAIPFDSDEKAEQAYKDILRIFALIREHFTKHIEVSDYRMKVAQDKLNAILQSKAS